MADGFSAIEVDRADRVVSGKSATEHVDLTSELALTEMRARVWYIEPGNTRKTYHRHGEQEELYYVLDGPGRIRIADEVLDVPAGTALRLSPETPRQVFNDTDDTHVWLVVGAPPVPNDGRAVDGE